MKSLLSFLIGAAVRLWIFTLVFPLPFYLSYPLWALCFGMLFFANPKISIPFVLGVTTVDELLGTARFGQVASFTAALLLLHHVFAERLRFTGQVSRFTIATLIALSGYTVLLGNTGSGSAWVTTLLTVLVASLIATAYTSAARTTHEFV